MKLGNKVVAVRELGAAPLDQLTTLRLEADFGVGANPITLETTRVSARDPSGRELAFIFESVTFCSDNAVPDLDAVRWDRSIGFGPLEAPYPPENLNEPFRWVEEARAVLVVDRVEASLVHLIVTYRVPMADQEALLLVNDVPHGRVQFDHVLFSSPGRIHKELLLDAGQNAIEFQLLKSIRTDGAQRDLYVLFEKVEVRPLDGSEH